MRPTCFFVRKKCFLCDRHDFSCGKMIFHAETCVFMRFHMFFEVLGLTREAEGRLLGGRRPTYWGVWGGGAPPGKELTMLDPWYNTKLVGLRALDGTQVCTTHGVPHGIHVGPVYQVALTSGKSLADLRFWPCHPQSFPLDRHFFLRKMIFHAENMPFRWTDIFSGEK